MARLSQKKRQHIKRRAAKEARRENSSANAGARATIQGANRDYGRDVRDARGAQRVETHQLSSMLQNLRESGLKGRYLRETAQELRARKMDAISGVPYAITQAQQARRDAIGDARAEIAQNAADLQADIGARTNDLLKEARENKTSRIEDRAKKREDKKGDNLGVKNALIIAKVAYEHSKPKEQAMFKKDPDLFAAGVAKKAEGADAVDARKAVAILFRRIHKSEHQFDRLNPFG